MREYLQSLGEQIMAEHAASNRVAHRGRKGSARETSLGRQLRKVLPARFGIGAGEIRASNGTCSGEHDLIIYDEPNCAFLFKDETVQVFPIESVYAVISVRSQLDSQHLIDFSDSVRQLRDSRVFSRSTPTALLDRWLVPGQTTIHVPPTPAAFAFGYKGASLKGLSDAMHRHYLASAGSGEFSPDPILNCVCVMGQGIITQIVRPGEVNTIYPFPSHPQEWALHVTTVENAQLAFGLFVSCLVYVLTETKVTPPALSYYTSAFTDMAQAVNMSIVTSPLPSGTQKISPQ